MLNWLTNNCDLLGFNGQNWMLVLAGGLLVYIAVLVIRQRRQAN
jgi:disulfide bond formation protein DsbB